MKANILIFVILFNLSYITEAQQLSIQTGHSSDILDLQFSPKGKYLFSCGKDNKIVIWDMTLSKQMNIFSGHTGAVNNLSVNKKNNTIASAGDDKTVRIWEYPSGKILKKFDFFTEKVKSVSFSPDGNNLACGSDSIYIIDLKSGKHTTLNKKARLLFNTVQYSENGKLLAFGGKNERKVFIYNTEKQRITKRIRHKANKIVFDNDDKMIYVAGEKGKIIRNTTRFISLKKNYNIPANYRWHSFFSVATNEKYFMGANRDKLIYVYKKSSGKRINILKAHTGAVKSLAVSPDGKYIASAGKDRKILIWNIEKGIITKTLKGGANSVNSISFTKDGKFMYIGYNNGENRVWNLASKGQIAFKQSPRLNFMQRYFRREYVTESTMEPFNINRVCVKMSLNRQDKRSEDIREKKSNLFIWTLRNQRNNRLIKSKHNTDYLDFMLSGTTHLLVFIPKSTHSQKYSLLNHKKIRDREEVFSTKVYRMTISQAASKRKLKPKGKSFKIKGDIYYKSVSKSGKKLLVLIKKRKNLICEIWDLIKRKKLKTIKSKLYFDEAGFTHDENIIYFTSKHRDSIYFYENDKITTKLKGSTPISFSSDSTYCSYTDNKRNFYMLNLKNKKQVFKVPSGHLTDISDIKFNMPYEYIATAGYDGLIKFWDIKTGELLISLAAFNEVDFVYVTPDNYYYSTKKAMDYISFVVNDKLYSFEQFDLKYNRPDLALARLPYSSKKEIAAYNKAYKKRLQKMNFGENTFDENFNIPTIKITNIDSFPIATTKDKISLIIKAKDSLYKLNRLNIWINDVPVFGKKGRNLTKNSSKTYNNNFELTLSRGKNKIQTSVINNKGIESLKETFTIIYDTKARKPDLYIVAIGVTEYENSEYNLGFAAKDADDITKLFSKHRKIYNKIHVNKILNKDATKSKILQVKKELMKTNVNDVVVIFFAGHGVLDADVNYYLATSEINTDNLSETALRYDKFESLFDEIPARKKVIFIDACHSGEVDEDEANNSGSLANTKKRNIKTNEFMSEIDVKTSSSFELMKTMFADVEKGTGATIISSAGGKESAIEGAIMKKNKIVKIKNGIFTHALINGLKSKKADKNRDGKITVSELQRYIFRQVTILSAGYQNPTSRRENLEFDFVIW